MKAGDYWLIPARSATGDIEWPHDDAGPLPRPPHGERRHYSPLAILQYADERWRVARDVRPVFEAAPILTAQSQQALWQSRTTQAIVEQLAADVAALSADVEVLKQQTSATQLVEDFPADGEVKIGDVVSCGTSSSAPAFTCHPGDDQQREVSGWHRK